MAIRSALARVLRKLSSLRSRLAGARWLPGPRHTDTVLQATYCRLIAVCQSEDRTASALRAVFTG